MSESIEHYKQTAEKSYNRSGNVWAENFEGPFFCIEGREYVLNERDGSSLVFDSETEELVSDEKIISAIKAKCEEDWEISCARGKVAEIFSNQNPILARILRIHLEYEGAMAAGHFKKNFKCEPYQKDGIDFYEVGHNATHHFYLGIKDGKVYKRSSYYDYNPETHEHIDEERVYEVPADDLGYIGHF